MADANTKYINFMMVACVAKAQTFRAIYSIICKRTFVFYGCAKWYKK